MQQRRAPTYLCAFVRLIGRSSRPILPRSSLHGATVISVYQVRNAAAREFSLSPRGRAFVRRCTAAARQVLDCTFSSLSLGSGCPSGILAKLQPLIPV